MITRVEISNYRSLGENVSFELGPFTALVGPNGSGKSNVVDVFRFVGDALRNGLENAIAGRRGIAAIRRWSAGRPFDVSFHIEIHENDFRGSYRFELGGDRTDDYRVKREYATCRRVWVEDDGPREAPPISFEVVEGEWKCGPPGLQPKIDRLGLVLPIIAADERFQLLATTLRNTAIYSIFPDTLREPQKPDPVKRMTEHGGNWCSILKQMKKDSREADLITALGQVTGDIDDVRVREIGGYFVTEFRHGKASRADGGKSRPRWFDAAQESDGTLRVAGIITALLQQPPLALTGVEEPELTIHPGAIPLLYDHLSEASTRGQVVVTTHSPELLSLMNANDVQVVQRREGATTVEKMEESQRDAVRDRLLTLGDLMRMEGLRQEPKRPASTVGG